MNGKNRCLVYNWGNCGLFNYIKFFVTRLNTNDSAANQHLFVLKGSCTVSVVKGTFRVY